MLSVAPAHAGHVPPASSAPAVSPHRLYVNQSSQIDHLERLPSLLFCVNQASQKLLGPFCDFAPFWAKTPTYKASFDGPFFHPVFSDPHATLILLSTVMENCPNPPQTTSLPAAI